MNKTVWVLVLLLATACASKPKYQLQPEATSGAQAKPLTLVEEQKLLASILPEIQKEYSVAAVPGVQNFIVRLSEKLLSHDNFKSMSIPYAWSYTVLNSTKPEAFTLPAGNIFITTAMIAATQSEAELASVLARQIVHATSQDVARRMMEIQKTNQPWSMVGGGLMGASMGYGMGKVGEDPTNGRRKFQILQFSPEEEAGNDTLTFDIAVNVGYNPWQVVRFYERQWTGREGQPLEGFEYRAENLKEYLKGRANKGLVSSKDYVRLQQQLKTQLMERPKKKKG